MIENIIFSILKTLLIFSIVIGAIILFYILHIVKKRRQYAHIPSPQMKSFIFGHFDRGSLINTHLKFIQWGQECGPVFHVQILHKIFVVTSSPDIAKTILTNSKYLKPESNYKKLASLCGVRFLGNGLVTNTNHENWKVRRNGINPSFHRNVISGFVQMFNDVADRLINSMEEYADTNQMVSMLDLLHETTLDAIGQAAFSENIMSSGIPEFNFCEAVSRCLKVRPLQERSLFFDYLPWNKPTIKQVRTDAQSLRAIGQRMIQNRIKAITNGEKTPEDILDCIVRNLAGSCSQEELVDEVMTMFIAGQETTANLLSFFILMIERYDHYKEQLYTEVDSVIGEKRFVTQEDAANLKWITASLKETLRLYPPITGTLRELPKSEELVLHNLIIPGGSIMLISFYGVHYLHHKDGFTFKPERFIHQHGSTEDDPGLQTDLFNYLPFSLGTRSCVGRNFAYLEAKIIASKLLQRFKFKLNPDESFNVENAGTMKPADGAKVFVQRR